MCTWPGADPLMIAYHDTEWGVPLHDDRKIFEFMVLDAFQAGLSWRTVLHKREAFRELFHDFEPEAVALLGESAAEMMMQDARIIRNRQKITAAISNAKSFLKVQKEWGTFDLYIWQFTNGAPIVHQYHAQGEVQPRSTESDAMSKDLLLRGFKFVGSTICYAFMQAAGMINDHLVNCPRQEICVGFSR